MRDDSRAALVRNAADADQVKRATRKERQRHTFQLAALQAVMETEAGRIVMWDLLERAGIYRTVFAPDSGSVYYQAGRQDFGHELLKLLLDAGEESYLLMEKEARTRARRERTENEAVHTAAAAAEVS